MRWPTTKQKKATFDLLKYKPFPLQEKVHRVEGELLQIVGAEGGGKSFVTAAEITACVPWCRLIYLIGQTYDNTHPEFNYLVENLTKLGALSEAKISQPRVGGWQLETLTGCKIVTLSVERGASSIIARGEQPDIIALCEAGIISSYGVLLASVRRVTRSRGKTILSGTLKDDFGWYASLVDELVVPENSWNGKTVNLPAWINTTLYPGGREDPQIKKLEELLPPEEFARTVAAKRMPSPAAVFPEFAYKTHVRDCPFDPSLPVHIWIDPGYFPSAYVVLAVQFHGNEVWIIDEIYLNMHTHQQVIAIAKNKPWWPMVKRAVIDFAGRQHHAEASAEEVWQSVARIKPHSQQVGILDGIARHRTFLKPARLYHDYNLKHTLAEYKKYRRPTDKDGNATSDLPIDKDNHAMKAIAYGLVDRFGFVDNPIPNLIGFVAQGRVKGW